MYAMPLQPKPTKPATYQDILDLPAHVSGELIDGTLYAQSRPASHHATAASAILSELWVAFGSRFSGPKGPGGWRILTEQELHLGGNVLVPDISGWRRERLPQLGATAHISVAPDWVCEVLSPSTQGYDRVLKARKYAKNGIRHMWIVDPQEHTLEVFELVGENYSLVNEAAGDATGRFKPFEDIEVDLFAWWDTDDARKREDGENKGELIL